MKVSVIGTGYVGLVSGACLADVGHDVICVDIDQQKVDLINSGTAPIYEKGLEQILKNNIGQRLNATTDIVSAIMTSDLSLIAVGTPFKGDTIDLSQIETVSQQIGEVLAQRNGYHVVVVKSTVVPGTTEQVVLPILEKSSGKSAGSDFGVGMNPEFLREGEAVIDFQHPDRIVLGGIDQKSLEVLAELYAPYRGVDVIRTTPKTAEMIKYTANSLLATMISFSNEIANLCTELGGIDVSDVMQGVHLDKRLTPIVDNGQRIVPNFTTYIEAGCGFGGSCFPKDVKALVAHGSHSGVPMRLLEAVIQINAQQPYKILTLLKKHFPSLKDLPVAVLGLAFKPGTDDMRESPAIPIVRELLRQGALIKAYDPVAMHEARKVFGDDRIQYCNTFQEAVEDVQGIVLLTRWPEFSEIPDMINALEQQPVVIDGRRMLEKNSVQKYDGIGLGHI
jgi:UDPglucose 6-dehydrogenase/GDP-mannose 6-dehydrogenase